MKKTLLAIAIGVLCAGLAGGAQAEASGAQAGFEERGPANVSLDSSLADLTADDIEGMTIVNAEGETLGEVRNVLRHDVAGGLHALVSVNGFWIFGGSDVALPLADMKLENEWLVLQEHIGQEKLDALGTDYDEDRYSDVDGDMTLSEAMER